MPTAYCLDGSNRPSRASQVPASSACHIYMRLEIRRMTGEVIKTGTTSLLSLILNMNHPSILDVWVCRHIWFSGEEAFACCLTLWLPFFWQEPLKCRPRGMDNGLSHSGTASHTLCAIPSDSHSRCSLHYTSPLFNPREVLASGQPSLSVWVTEYVHACVCVCGNVGSACSPRAMLINALQTKCSPFSLFSLSPPLLPSSAQSLQPSEWSLLRGKEEVVLGDGAGCWREVHEQSRIWEEVHYSGLRQCWALPLSPSCLLCLMLRAINIFNWELLLRLSFTSHAIHNQPTFTILQD